MTHCQTDPATIIPFFQVFPFLESSGEGTKSLEPKLEDHGMGTGKRLALMVFFRVDQ